MKYVSGKILVLIILVALSTFVMRPSSAQFDCDTGGGGGGGDPSPTPACHHEYYYDYIQQCTNGYCCRDTYLVDLYICNGNTESVTYTLTDHYCWET